jgi:hypothetical protein
MLDVVRAEYTTPAMILEEDRTRSNVSALP